MTVLFKIFFFFLVPASLTIDLHAQVHPRAIFLNGIDVSGAKHQLLENVTVRIDGTGQIFIEAPHYEVNEESTYIPLSSWNKEKLGAPMHRGLAPVPNLHDRLPKAADLQAKPKQARAESVSRNENLAGEEISEPASRQLREN